MLKNILNLDGVQELNKEQQKAVNGGRIICDDPVFSHIVPPGEGAINGGQGGIVYTQQCVDTGFLGLGKDRHFVHEFWI